MRLEPIVWSTISVDPARNLVFVPTTSPSTDYYGGGRLFDIPLADAAVAGNAATGEDVVVRSAPIRRKVPVERYLELQTRFTHLLGPPQDTNAIAAIQAIADANIGTYGLWG